MEKYGLDVIGIKSNSRTMRGSNPAANGIEHLAENVAVPCLHLCSYKSLIKTKRKTVEPMKQVYIWFVSRRN